MEEPLGSRKAPGTALNKPARGTQDWYTKMGPTNLDQRCDPQSGTEDAPPPSLPYQVMYMLGGPSLAALEHRQTTLGMLRRILLGSAEERARMNQ